MNTMIEYQSPLYDAPLFADSGCCNSRFPLAGDLVSCLSSMLHSLSLWLSIGCLPPTDISQLIELNKGLSTDVHGTIDIDVLYFNLCV
jgi:hypothetical protein